uniref:Uncharacterized protein n=1 Tax=Medicago truncatula TaxID=3880 RepID=I3T6V4_MEDTR|nr:unknown [Medicago truncatula]
MINFLNSSLHKNIFHKIQLLNINPAQYCHLGFEQKL